MFILQANHPSCSRGGHSHCRAEIQTETWLRASVRLARACRVVLRLLLRSAKPLAPFFSGELGNPLLCSEVEPLRAPPPQPPALLISLTSPSCSENTAPSLPHRFLADPIVLGNEHGLRGRLYASAGHDLWALVLKALLRWQRFCCRRKDLTQALGLF